MGRFFGMGAPRVPQPRAPRCPLCDRSTLEQHCLTRRKWCGWLVCSVCHSVWTSNLGRSFRLRPLT